MDAAVMRGVVDELVPVWLQEAAAKLAVAGVVVGLLLVASAICLILWRVRRRRREPWTELPPPRYPHMGTDEQIWLPGQNPWDRPS